MKIILCLIMACCLSLFSACSAPKKTNNYNKNTTNGDIISTTYTNENVVEHNITQNNTTTNHPSTQFNENDATTKALFNKNETINYEKQQIESPFNELDFLEIRVMIKKSKDSGNSFSEIKKITDVAELDEISNALNQGDWLFYPTSKGWAKFRPSLPNNHIINVKANNGYTYVIHLYSNSDSTNFFVSVANYNSEMLYEDFLELPDENKNFNRYTITKDLNDYLLNLCK